MISASLICELLNTPGRFISLGLYLKRKGSTGAQHHAHTQKKKMHQPAPPTLSVPASVFSFRYGSSAPLPILCPPRTEEMVIAPYSSLPPPPPRFDIEYACQTTFIYSQSSLLLRYAPPPPTLSLFAFTSVVFFLLRRGTEVDNDQSIV